MIWQRSRRLPPAPTPQTVAACSDSVAAVDRSPAVIHLPERSLAMSRATTTDDRRLHTPRRGLNRVEAAIYVGVSPSKFDELVKDGRMPKPKKIDARRIFDVRALDLAFDELEGESDANEWDAS